MKDLQQELELRGLLYQNSSEELFDVYQKWGENFYIGYDPTADSLHLWNFIGFMTGVHFMRRKNKYFALIGWATGMIGDPGWKDAERTFLSFEQLGANQQAIEKQMWNIFQNLESITWESFEYEVVNNKDFYTWMWFLDFLREVGKFVTVNKMISKDTVKKRIEDPSQSISYTEFSYMLLQWFDFFHLFSQKAVKLQMWWQDQWGNLVTGSELIRKKVDGDSYVATWPLITDATGKKFWKSEWNALFLDKDKTSPYEVYQYFMNTADTDVDKYLKILTLVEIEEIEELVNTHLEFPEKREWQKRLAYEVVRIIHGDKEADTARKITEFLFGSPLSISSQGREATTKMQILETLDSEELRTFQKAMWWFEYSWENLFETIVKSWLAKSNGEARNSVKSGAIHINEEKISDFNTDVSGLFSEAGVLFIRKGKKNMKLILRK